MLYNTYVLKGPVVIAASEGNEADSTTVYAQEKPQTGTFVLYCILLFLTMQQHLLIQRLFKPQLLPRHDRV